MAQAVKYLLGKLETLSSNPRTIKKKKSLSACIIVINYAYSFIITDIW
jgi:hypothetical protein